MERESVGRETAKWLIEKTDRDRECFIRTIYGKEWDDAGWYDMAFDTGNRPLEEVSAVLKHELAHWAARWRYGSKIAPHGPEFRLITHALDPRITVTCPPFAAREKKQRRTFRMMCPHCHRTYHRGRRDKVACRACCERYAHGRYDRRFTLVAATHEA